MYFLHIIKKKGSFKLEKEILSDIKQLENNLMEGDVYVLEQKRYELLELRQKKLDGMIVRSRAKWLYEGENFVVVVILRKGTLFKRLCVLFGKITVTLSMIVML